MKLVDEDFPFPDFKKEAKQEKAYDVAEIRKKHPRAYKKWTTLEDFELSTQFEKGMSIQQLAKHLQRQQGAIRSRLKKLNLQH